MGLHPGSVSTTRHRTDRELRSHPQALLHQSQSDQPEWYRSHRSGTGFFCSAWAWRPRWTSRTLTAEAITRASKRASVSFEASLARILTARAEWRTPQLRSGCDNAAKARRSVAPLRLRVRLHASCRIAIARRSPACWRARRYSDKTWPCSSENCRGRSRRS